MRLTAPIVWLTLELRRRAAWSDAPRRTLEPLIARFAMLFFAVGLCVYLFGGVVLLAGLRPGYSHRRDTISELSERGAPRAKLTGLCVFLPVGLGLWWLAYLVWPQERDVGLLAASLGAGYVVGGVFPPDYGLPRHGSWRQKLHNAGGLIEYLGSAYALYRLAPAHLTLDAVFYAAALFAPLTAATAFFRPFRPVRGLVQRIAECLLFGLMTLSVSGLARAAEAAG